MIVLGDSVLLVTLAGTATAVWLLFKTVVCKGITLADAPGTGRFVTLTEDVKTVLFPFCAALDPAVCIGGLTSVTVGPLPRAEA